MFVVLLVCGVLTATEVINTYIVMSVQQLYLSPISQHVVIFVAICLIVIIIWLTGLFSC